ncbi:MAG: DUF3604 domain-containing protein [Fimbriimonadaceae bacterium]|nr:DUF3604 domain-containing protein [Chitinophagales bacterium]
MKTASRFIYIVFILTNTFFAKAQGICYSEKSDALSAFVYPNRHFIKTKTSYRIYITPEDISLPAGSSIKIWFVKGVEVLQYADSTNGNFVFAYILPDDSAAEITGIENNNEELFYLWDYDGDKSQVITIKTNREIVIGDTLIVQFGTTTNAGKLTTPSIDFTDNFKIAYNENNDTIFFELVDKPEITYLPDTTAVYISATIESISKPGDTCILKIRAFDLYYNHIKNYTGTFFIECNEEGVIFPGSVTMQLTDSGKLDIPVVCNAENIYRFLTSADDTNISAAYSNPVYVTNKNLENIYWGDIHNHSQYSRDAHGAQALQYARDAMCLDFYSEADHAEMQVNSNIAGINCEEMQTIIQEANANNADGKFISFVGYEISKNTSEGGHHHFIFNFNSSDTIPIFFKEETIENIFADAEKIPGLQMLAVPHHTGKQFDATDTFTNCVNHFGNENINSQFRRIAEIYSGHGTSEYYDPENVLSYENQSSNDVFPISVNGPNYLQDAWAVHEKFSVVASTDDHKGKPGMPRKGVSAVFAKELTRDIIFDGLYNRKTYATTGERIIMDITVNDTIMGRDVILGENDFPLFDMQIFGTDTIEYIQILKWDFINGKYTAGHPQYDTVKTFYPGGWNFNEPFSDSTYLGCSMYYVRMKQIANTNIFGSNAVDAAYAWSSPFWVARKNESCPVVFLSDSLNEIEIDFSIYPNPASSVCLIKGNANIDAIYLYDINGKRLSQKKYTQGENYFVQTLLLNDLSKGLYFIQIISGRSIINKKIIKQ